MHTGTVWYMYTGVALFIRFLCIGILLLYREQGVSCRPAAVAGAPGGVLTSLVADQLDC